MNLIKDFQDLPEDEINELIRNFRPTQKKGLVKDMTPNVTYVNEYNKQFIDVSNNLVEKVKNIIQPHFPSEKIVFRFARLNKVETDTNPSDGFHTDLGSGNVIFLHYPKSNPPYEGGDFEIEDGERIHPINGLNLILVDNPPHRVLNVTNGERYSFAFFFMRFKQTAIL